MSELINSQAKCGIIRKQLLATASALTLAAYITSAKAEDADRPTVWIELGGQLDSLNSPQQALSPPFMASITQANLVSALNVQKPPAYAIDEDAKILFQPENSDWVFSASIQFGRSSANRHRHQQTANKTVPAYVKFSPPLSNYHLGPINYYPTSHAKFADGQAQHDETHAIVDFQAGKDVGLGMFGGRGSSVLSGGIRIAQFTSKSNISLRAEPDLHYPTAAIHSKYGWATWLHYHAHFHDYGATASVQRSFQGFGPSLSWNASAPFAGDSGHGELSLDWDVNGSVLFGRQRARGQHKTAVHYYLRTGWQEGFGKGGKLTPGRFVNVADNYVICGGEQFGSEGGPISCHTNAASFNRVRTVTVPNIGGSVGLSFRIEDFKVAVGYRADLFFGAMDGGIDTSKSENKGFFGPFASVSIGLGG